MKKYRSFIIIWLVFEVIAVWLWQTTGNLFFLLNFSYIGLCIGLGGILFAASFISSRPLYLRFIASITLSAAAMIFMKDPVLRRPKKSL